MNQEHYQRKELDPELVKGFADTFINRWDRYPWMQPSGEWVGVQKLHLTLDMVEQHVRGNTTIGAYCLNPGSKAKWICFDADDETVAALARFPLRLKTNAV